MKEDYKIEYKNLFKKGNQYFKIFLGFIEKNIHTGQDVLSFIINFIKSIFLFTVALLAEIVKFPFVVFANSKKILFEIWQNIQKPFYDTLGIFVAIFFVLLLVLSIIVLINHISPNFVNILSSK